MNIKELAKKYDLKREDFWELKRGENCNLGYNT